MGVDAEADAVCASKLSVSISSSISYTADSGHGLLLYVFCDEHVQEHYENELHLFQILNHFSQRAVDNDTNSQWSGNSFSNIIFW